MDLIHVLGLELRCIVGLRSYERRREQPLKIDVSLGLDLSTAGRSGQIGDSVDYSTVADEVTALLRFREYRLLEVAAEEATALLFAAHPLIQQVRIRLDKPEALAGRARSAAVEMTRSRGAFGSTWERTECGARVELLRSAEGIVEFLHVDPGKTLHLADDYARLEIVLAGPSRGRILLLGREQPSQYQAGDAPLSLCRCVALPDPARGRDLPAADRD
jgi:FolB domain-containing protein